MSFSAPPVNLYSDDVPRAVGLYEGLDWLESLRVAWVADPDGTRSSWSSAGPDRDRGSVRQRS
jgi:hypothetical protein